MFKRAELFDHTGVDLRDGKMKRRVKQCATILPSLSSRMYKLYLMVVYDFFFKIDQSEFFVQSMIKSFSQTTIINYLRTSQN